jgi:hypothetical protein
MNKFWRKISCMPFLHSDTVYYSVGSYKEGRNLQGSIFFIDTNTEQCDWHSIKNNDCSMEPCQPRFHSILPHGNYKNTKGFPLSVYSADD